MFSRKCVCKLNISKIVRPLLAALSVNGLIPIIAIIMEIMIMMMMMMMVMMII